MNWLSQNWFWILLAVGAILWFGRGRHFGMGGFGHGHHGRQGGDDDYRDRSGRAADPQKPTDPRTVTDPVTHEGISTEHALSSVYQGRIYYFKTPENRQRFEATPEQYAPRAHEEPAARSSEFDQHRRRRRRGC